MTHRPGRLARLAAAAFLAALTLPAVAGPAGAASATPITLEARALVGGRFMTDGWIAISATLSNDGPPTTGYVAVDGEDGTVRRFVELPAGAHKQVAIYVRPAAFVRTVVLRFESPNGASLATASSDLRVLERTSGHVAIVGDGGGNLRPQLIARGAGFPEPIPLTPADLPERPEPLRGIGTIVWAADSGALTELQRRSLERWVAAGGQLVVLGGPDWQARTAAFDALLPVDQLASRDASSPAAFAAWAGASAPDGTGSVTASVGHLRAGAISLVGDGAGTLLAAISRGAGRVGFIGIDLATAPFRSWAGAPLLWTRLLPDDRIAEQFGGPGPADADIANAMAQALANLPSLAVPPAELLLAVVIGYILLIGPLSYLVLRRIDRRELAWVVAPILVIVFSGASYGIGLSMKGSQIIVNQIAVVRTSADGTAASVSTYAGISSPTRATYDLSVRGDALLSALQVQNDPNTGGTVVNYATEQGDPARLRGLAVSVFSQQAIRAEAVLPYAPSLRVTWSVTASSLEGRVTNEGAQPMEDVAIISPTGGVLVGTLEAGGSKSFRLTLTNVTGISASQQVYGNSAFDTSTAAARRVLVRSQVIDALVGFGGGGFPGKVGGISGGVDRGPFVIGWQPDAAPLEVQLDGQAVQRYAQSVEVVSGQPTLGPGTVTVRPSQLSTEVVSTAGDASQPQPGYVTIANGEVTFRISLPLEATGIVPSKVTIIAGTDPTTIFFDQQNVGAFLPAGFRMAIYDNALADWTDLGDLSQRNRFDVADPSHVLDAAGRMLVRITGSSIPKDIGQVGVFAGAQVTGALAR